MAIAISRRYLDIDFPNGLSVDQKIEVFADRVIGWQLEPAQELADKVPNSGFAVLHVVMSYFENIAKFEEGYCQDNLSRCYFRKGFKSVVKVANPAISDDYLRQFDSIIDLFYRQVRCGLYHAGSTGPSAVLSGEFTHPIAFSIDTVESSKSRIHINPHLIVGLLNEHFQSFLRVLRNSREIDSRERFEKRFNYVQSANPDVVDKKCPF